jgi:hypothetical protein
MELYTLILQEAGPGEALAICKQFGRQDPTLWSDALVKLANADGVDPILGEFLVEVERENALPFLTLLKVLRAAKKHTFKTVLPLVQATFQREQRRLNEAEARRKSAEEVVAKNQAMVHTLATQNFVVTQAKCEACGRPIEGESRHFLCKHSYHRHCILETEKFCPTCRTDYEQILESKVARMSRAADTIEAGLHGGEDYEFLLSEVRQSLFAAGLDFGSSKRNDELLEAKELLARIQNRS